jgi:hypothetical protein
MFHSSSRLTQLLVTCRREVSCSANLQEGTGISTSISDASRNFQVHYADCITELRPVPDIFKCSDGVTMRTLPLAVSTQRLQNVLVTDETSCYDQNNIRGLRINRKEPVSHFLSRIDTGRSPTIQLVPGKDLVCANGVHPDAANAENFNVPSGYDVFIVQKGIEPDRLKRTTWTKSLLREILPYLPGADELAKGYSTRHTITALYCTDAKFTFGGGSFYSTVLFSPCITVQELDQELDDYIKETSNGEFGLKMALKSRGSPFNPSYEGTLG